MLVDFLKNLSFQYSEEKKKNTKKSEKTWKKLHKKNLQLFENILTSYRGPKNFLLLYIRYLPSNLYFTDDLI